MEENIIGGVSPMKRRGKSRGKGRRGTGDTRYKRDKWVPPASGGTITPNTTKAPPPAKPYVIKDGKVELTPTATADADASASSTPGSPAEGYWKDNYKDVTTKTEGERTVKLPKYEKAWKDNLDGITGMYNSFDDYVADIEGQKKMAKKKDWKGIAEKKIISVEQAKKDFATRNKTEKFSEEKTEKVYDGKEWVETKAKTDGTSESSSSSSASSGVNMLGSPGKYALGGYRAMKKNKKQ